MQLFGLVNTMLANDRATAERDLSIARYAVIPLSPNSGLIGWVPNTDTLHALIREYRDARKVHLLPSNTDTSSCCCRKLVHSVASGHGTATWWILRCSEGCRMLDGQITTKSPGYSHVTLLSESSAA